MSNKKTYVLFFASFAWICGCKITSIPFAGNKMNFSFFDNVTKLWIDTSVNRIDSITIYTAVLQEELVDRDGIPEFKLINTESLQPRADLVDQKNRHELYLCQVHTNKKNETLCVFVAASFNIHNQCTKLGPAYLGVIRMEQINIKEALKITERKDSTYFISDTTASKILFIAENSIGVGYKKLCNVDAPDKSCEIRIREIINSNVNKIGGKKPTLYDIKRIFNDKDALLFTYSRTIKK